MTCSQSNWVPKARTPRTWVTVLASQPSVSMETETTQRMGSPSLPSLPTVFIDFAQEVLVGDFAGLLDVAALDDLPAETFDLHPTAMSRKSLSRASPDSSCSLSMRSVRGRARRLPFSSKLRKSSRRPAWLTRVSPSSPGRVKPET